MEWKRVEDELPDSDELVMLYVPDQRISEPVWGGYLDTFDECWRWQNGAEIEDGRVTHWMKWPEPPSD